jgi:hypothetical protein
MASRRTDYFSIHLAGLSKRLPIAAFGVSIDSLAWQLLAYMIGERYEVI